MEKGSRLTQAEDSSWPESLSWGSGRGRRRVRGRKRETASSISQQRGKGSEEGRHRRGAKAKAGDRSRKAGQPEISGQTDGKGWRARARGRKWGEEAAKGQEQMRAAGVLNRALDTENGNGGGGV